MKITDYIVAICTLIVTAIEVMKNRKLIHTNLKSIYDTDGFKITNNLATMVCSIFIVLCYTILALFAWVFKFNLSAFGFYICLIGAIPFTMFSIHFYRVNYLKVS